MVAYNDPLGDKVVYNGPTDLMVAYNDPLGVRVVYNGSPDLTVIYNIFLGHFFPCNFIKIYKVYKIIKGRIGF